MMLREPPELEPSKSESAYCALALALAAVAAFLFAQLVASSAIAVFHAFSQITR